MTEKLSKTQIDRLGDRLRHGQVSESDLRLLDEYRRSFGEAYESVVQTIRDQLHLAPTGRPAKSTGSIIEKLQRESIRLTQVQDIAGCRVLVSDVLEQERVIALLRAAFPSASLVDRRERPSYGYRAVHLIVKTSGKLVEVQVRSSLQHLWAEYSEKLSDLFDPAIKYGGGTKKIRNILTGTSELVAKIENMEKICKRLFEIDKDELQFLKQLQSDFAKTKNDLIDTLKNGIVNIEKKEGQKK